MVNRASGWCFLSAQAKRNGKAAYPDVGDASLPSVAAASPRIQSLAKMNRWGGGSVARRLLAPSSVTTGDPSHGVSPGKQRRAGAGGSFIRRGFGADTATAALPFATIGSLPSVTGSGASSQGVSQPVRADSPVNVTSTVPPDSAADDTDDRPGMSRTVGFDVARIVSVAP